MTDPLRYCHGMRTSSTPRLAALVALIIGTTVGSPAPATAAPTSHFAPSIAVGKPEAALVPDLLPELAEAEAARLEYEQRLAAWLAWEAAEKARLAAELDHLWALWILDVYDRVAARTGRYLPWPTVAMIIDASTARGVDPVLVGKIGACESGGRADAYNPSGASGFGQHLWGYWWARADAAGHPGASPFDLWANIDTTAWYLSVAGTSPWAPSRFCWS